MTAFADALDQLELSLEDLAAAAGVSVDAARRWRSGANVPGPAQAARLADTLGVPLERLRPDLTPLARELARQGLTAGDLAARAGVHANSVYTWASGKVTPTRPAAEAAASALGVPAARLFPELPTRCARRYGIGG